MKVFTGSYTGNGTDNHAITGVGFLPDLVLIKGGAVNRQSHFKITQHGTNESIAIRSDASSVTDAIKTLDSDGFTLGVSSNVNTSAETFYYLAVKDDGNGDFKTGTYTGDNTDGLAITGLGFQPCFVLIKSNASILGAMKFAGQTDTSMVYDGGDDRIDLIVSLDANGFTVNNGSGSGANIVNINAVTHYYFAFKAVANYITAFQYAGNSTDNRDITTPGFQPDFVIAAAIWGRERVIRFASNSGDASQSFESATTANWVQSFISTGFQVGSADAANVTGTNINALALRSNPVSASAANSNFFQFF